MTPVEIKQGKSFKGLATYLLHDAKREGEQSRDTTERVGMVQSYNLGDAVGEQAWRRMLATANSANALKEAAGIKKGKAVKNTVYHYSLNFHPDDPLTPEIQRAAVEGSLKALGLDDHQALAVEHTDKAHNHIHVMVNLIDPANGMSAATPQMGEDGKKRSKLSNSQRKLSSWAGRFERDHGLNVTEGRLANANKREQGERVNARRKSRKTYEREKREATTDRRKDFLKRQHNDRAKAIQERTAELKEQSRAEWDGLKESYGAEKAAIKAQMSPAMKERSAEIKELFKPYWADMFKRHRDEVKAFEAGDRSAIGRIWTAAAAFKERALDGDYLGGFVAAFSKESRRNIVLKKHDREREAMGERLQEQIAKELATIKREFDRQFTQARSRFMDRCDELKAKQDVSWQEIRDAWQSYNNDRAAAFSKTKDRQASLARSQKQGRGLGRSPS
jgi:hypothetical protein